MRGRPYVIIHQLVSITFVMLNVWPAWLTNGSTILFAMMVDAIPHWTYRCVVEHLGSDFPFSGKTLRYDGMWTLFHVNTHEYMLLFSWVA